MQKPLQITFRDMETSEALEARIRAKAAKLEALEPRITSCHVVVERLSARHRTGNDFAVRMVLHVPGREISVDDKRHEDPYVAVRDAFDAAARMLNGSPLSRREHVRQPAPEA